jgi:hypothetical protein
MAPAKFAAAIDIGVSIDAALAVPIAAITTYAMQTKVRLTLLPFLPPGSASETIHAAWIESAFLNVFSHRPPFERAVQANLVTFMWSGSGLVSGTAFIESISRWSLLHTVSMGDATPLKFLGKVSLSQSR